MKITINNKGFTLLETLASITILAFVLIGPLAVMINSSKYARDSQDLMVARYLAEEATELLQNRADSLFLFCRKFPDNAKCATTLDETSSEISWREFKKDFGTTSPTGPTCYTSATSTGCAFDPIGITLPATSSLQLFTATGGGCPYLVAVELPTFIKGHHVYMCQSNIVASSTATTIVLTTDQVQRMITLERLPNYDATLPVDQQYNDDMRATVEVKLKNSSTRIQSIKLTKFIHRRT